MFFLMEAMDLVWSLLVLGFSFLCVPLLAASYLFVRISHGIWYKVISILNPEVEFIESTTFRTLVDTHRNQGIISVLLTIRGVSDSAAVRRHLQEVVNRKDKLGNVVFPHLKKCLITKFGTYAWKQEEFSLDQNLLVAPFIYKGRSVTEMNIQDCVSEMVCKYLPSGLPPWQVVIIPSSENHHYILLRLHHILLSNGLNIADLLPLTPPVRNIMETTTENSPLVGVFKKPENIPHLKERLTEEFTNRWNEFISNHDPLERPELLKTTPGVFQFSATALITSVSIFKECRKGFRVINRDFISRLQYFNATLRRETFKRKVSFGTLLESIALTLSPSSFLKFFLKYWWSLVVTFTFTIPLMVYQEFASFLSCVFYKYPFYQNTLVGNSYNYVPLFFYATREFLNGLLLFLRTPRVVLEEILSAHGAFQPVTLCGRKAVSWSTPVESNYVKVIAQSLGVTETEVVLAACSASFAKYFARTKVRVPREIPICCRNISSGYVFSTGSNVKPEDSINGMLCVKLPINSRDVLKGVKENVVEAREKQPLTYLFSVLQTKYGVLSKLVPATFLSVCLKYLSGKYAVAFTELGSRKPGVVQRTLWGQEVVSVLYWRPPQANICISLCLNEYANKMVMAVMCDAQLVPHHTILTRGFHEHIEDLAKIAFGKK